MVIAMKMREVGHVGLEWQWKAGEVVASWVYWMKA